MRLLSGIIITVAIIIAGGFYVNHQLRQTSEQLVTQIVLVNEAIEQGDWNAAAAETDELDQVWEEQAGWWPVFFEHDEMHNIEFSMAKFKAYVDCHNVDLSLGQLSEIRLMIEHMPGKEEVILDNIF